MAQFFDALTAEHVAFLHRQPMFFVATAAADARINLSPKGMDSFHILSPKKVAYLDVGGSGNETQAHLEADGRITIMFCSFDTEPLILRLYGTGTAVLPQDATWADVSAPFTLLPGTRQIFLIDIDSIQTSCGWGVPLMTLDQERDTLLAYHAVNQTPERLARIATRTQSIDGLPVRAQGYFPAQR